MLRASDFVRGPTLASLFHGRACAFLTHHGFNLINEPSESFGRYNFSSAKYKAASNLYLTAAFEPYDGNDGQIFFGRQWIFGGYTYLSNNYAVMAKRFGFDVRSLYRLREEDGDRTIEVIVSDLQRSLPTVISKIQLQDVVTVEQEPYGAKSLAKMILRTNDLSSVQISSLDLRA
jgi:hypothetical protein